MAGRASMYAEVVHSKCLAHENCAVFIERTIKEVSRSNGNDINLWFSLSPMVSLNTVKGLSKYKGAIGRSMC